MTRNQNSHFALNPTKIDISRSTFNSPKTLKTSWNVGDIIPIFWTEILPGDSLSLSTSMVVRLQSLITPIFDNLYLDTYYFFIPYRLVWSHFVNMMGENTESAWVPTTQYTVPQIESPASTGWTKGTLADYFGVPIGVTDLSISALPFRCYALVMNDWFRSENLQNPLNIPVGDSTITGVNTGTYVTDVVKGGLPYKACKFQDYFTSCLPAPLKSGADVLIPLGANADAKAPVYGIDNLPLHMRILNASDGNVYQSSSASYLGYTRPFEAAITSPSPFPNVLTSMGSLGTGSNVSSTLGGGMSRQDTYAVGMNVVSKEAASNSNIPSSVYADIGNTLGASVSQLRLAFQIQKMYERDARGGTRYIELLKSHFSVEGGDYRLQRPEYLGGKRIPIHINQVVQQSETSNTPQGNVAGYSVTADTHQDFTKSFVEHGFVLGLAVARYDHTYQQGLERFWKRQDRFDFYWPALANLSEQPVYNYQIYTQGDSVVDANGDIIDNQVFGFNEAWAEYRYLPSLCTGEMRSTYSASLDSWHLGDDYSALPQLGDSWIMEDSSNVDRVIAVSQQNADQLFGDFYFKAKFTRPMPLYSIPGLIDHH